MYLARLFLAQEEYNLYTKKYFLLVVLHVSKYNICLGNIYMGINTKECNVEISYIYNYQRNKNKYYLNDCDRHKNSQNNFQEAIAYNKRTQCIL